MHPIADHQPIQREFPATERPQFGAFGFLLTYHGRGGAAPRAALPKQHYGRGGNDDAAASLSSQSERGRQLSIQTQRSVVPSHAAAHGGTTALLRLQPKAPGTPTAMNEPQQATGGAGEPTVSPPAQGTQQPPAAPTHLHRPRPCDGDLYLLVNTVVPTPCLLRRPPLYSLRRPGNAGKRPAGHYLCTAGYPRGSRSRRVVCAEHAAKDPT